MPRTFQNTLFSSLIRNRVQQSSSLSNPGKRREEVYSFIVPIQTIKIAKQGNVFPYSTIILNFFFKSHRISHFPWICFLISHWIPSISLIPRTSIPSNVSFSSPQHGFPENSHSIHFIFLCIFSRESQFPHTPEAFDHWIPGKHWDPVQGIRWGGQITLYELEIRGWEQQSQPLENYSSGMCELCKGLHDGSSL